MELKIVVKKGGKIPKYSHDEDAGFDIYASEDVIIPAKGYTTVPTGVYINIPSGFHVEIRSRSGLAARDGVFVLNSPGTVDAGYTGEWKIILGNMGNFDYDVRKGDRIAQGVLMANHHAEFSRVNKLPTTIRGEGGFGHTGK